jgi:alpha-beta hydrolase superfamily lysophospholipase
MGKILSRLLPKFGIVGIDAEGVSKDPAVVQAYIHDPLVYRGKTTARLGAELLKAMQQVAEQAGKIALPMIILQGSEDKLVDPGCGQLLYDSVSSTDKILKIYDGYYHEVHNEPGRDQVFQDLESWLEAHLK